MNPRSAAKKSIQNIITTDGCIDLVVNYNDRQIGFAGMSKTDFHFTIEAPNKFCGARMKPGAFQQLTGLPATAAMDNFVPLERVDAEFDSESFFILSFEQAKAYLKNYLQQFVYGKTPNNFLKVFDIFSISPPLTTAELYQSLHLSARQSQRAFIKHFGLTPQMVLSIIRFQRCLKILTSDTAAPSDILEALTYYDQSHFIKDFKKNIGFTPLEYIKKCKN